MARNRPLWLKRCLNPPALADRTNVGYPGTFSAKSFHSNPSGCMGLMNITAPEYGASSKSVPTRNTYEYAEVREKVNGRRYGRNDIGNAYRQRGDDGYDSMILVLVQDTRWVRMREELGNTRVNDNTDAYKVR